MTLSAALSRFAAGPLSGADTARAVARLSALDWLAVARARVCRHSRESWPRRP